MPIKKVKEFLNRNNVKYTIITHSPAYTAPEIAASAHIPGKQLAKTVIVKVDGKLVMVVEPAHLKIDLKSLKEALGATKVELASEFEFQDKFPGCEVGAMPPFGHLFDMEVYLCDQLKNDEHIAFNAGNHSELIKMSFQDFKKLEQPHIIKC